MKTRLALTLLLVLVAVLQPGAVPAHAGQIILSINSSTIGGAVFPPDVPSYAWSQGWSSANAYTNASISISLLAFPDDVEFPLEAFLVTQIGPGTTPADQVAYTALTASVRGVPSTVDPYDTSVMTHVPLFSGLTLDAGDYYLVIRTPGYTSSGEWLEVQWAANWELDININTAPGVGNLRLFSADGLVTGYAPATPFSEQFYTYAWLEVTGEPVSDPGSTALLLGMGLAGLSAWRKRRQ